MKKILYTLPLILIVLTLTLTQIGCKGDEVVTPEDVNLDKEATESKNLVELAKVLTEANSISWKYLNSIASSGSCPSYNFDSSVTALGVSYGDFPGCISSDNTKRSGSYRLTPKMFGSGDSTFSNISFLDYMVYKFATTVDTNRIRMIGSLAVSSKKVTGTSYNFRASGEVIYVTNLGASKSITINSINGSVNYNTPGTSTDDTYSIYGSLKIIDNGVTYDVTITQSGALQITAACHYPLSGSAQVGAVNSDFSPNSNACDGLVRLNKGSTTKTYDLNDVNF